MLVCGLLGTAVQRLQAHPGLGCCKTRRMVGGQSQRRGVKELPGVPGIGAWGRGFWGGPRNRVVWGDGSTRVGGVEAWG